MVVYNDYGEKKKNCWRETDSITVPSDHELTALTTRSTSCYAYAFNMYNIGIDPYVKIQAPQYVSIHNYYDHDQTM